MGTTCIFVPQLPDRSRGRLLGAEGMDSMTDLLIFEGVHDLERDFVLLCYAKAGVHPNEVLHHMQGKPHMEKSEVVDNETGKSAPSK